MKLLFDQNVSFRILEKIELVFPHSEQVRHLGLENARDIENWHFAKKQGYTYSLIQCRFFRPVKLIWPSPPNYMVKDRQQENK